MRLFFAATAASLFAASLVPAALAAPAPASSTYVVPFDCGKANLTAKGQASVTEAVSAVKAIAIKSLTQPHHDAFHYVNATVTAGADKGGQARANAVKDEMVRQGLFANGISVKNDAGHAPQNCSAVIALDN